MSENLANRAEKIISQEDEGQLLDAVQKWLDRDVRDKVLELEHADDYPHEMVDQMKELGLFGATFASTSFRASKLKGFLLRVVLDKFFENTNNRI